MIKTFKHKGLKRYFMDNEKELLNKKQQRRIARLLDRLDAAEEIADMGLPGFGLHLLKGNKKIPGVLKSLEIGE